MEKKFPIDFHGGRMRIYVNLATIETLVQLGPFYRCDQGRENGRGSVDATSKIHRHLR